MVAGPCFSETTGLTGRADRQPRNGRFFPPPPDISDRPRPLGRAVLAFKAQVPPNAAAG